jgi:hypothetical protein
MSSLAMNNTIVGFGSGNTISSGTNNTLLGSFAGDGLESGTFNTYIGTDAGSQGDNNTVVGGASGNSLTAGSMNNTIIGFSSGTNLTSGSYNTIIGAFTDSTTSTGVWNILIGGAGAGISNGNENIFMGNGAGIGGSDNLCIGNFSGARGKGNNNVYIGSTLGDFTDPPTGSDNLIIGRHISPTLEKSCIYIGDGITTGNQTGSLANISGVIAFGKNHNIGRVIGAPTNQPISDCCVMGQGIELNPISPGMSYTSVFGRDISVESTNRAVIVGQESLVRNRSDQVTLCNSNTFLSLTSIGHLVLSSDVAIKQTAGGWVGPSDARLKHDIVNANTLQCENLIRQIDLKRFAWNDEREDAHQLGFVAQDVEKYLPKSVTVGNMFGVDDCKLLDTTQLTMAMYGALKRCIVRIDELEARLTS